MKQGARNLWVANNLEALTHLSDGSVTLAYLDPPFNSGRSYEAILSAARQPDELHRDMAFKDRWTWNSEVAALSTRLEEWLSRRAAAFVRDLANALGGSDTAAYLVSMAARLAVVHKKLTMD